MELSDHLTAKALSLSRSLWLLSTWGCTWCGAGLPLPPKPPLSARKAVFFFLSKTPISPSLATLPVTGASSPPGSVTPMLVLNVCCWQQRSGCCNPGEHSHVSPTREGDGGVAVAPQASGTRRPCCGPVLSPPVPPPWRGPPATRLGSPPPLQSSLS